MESSSARASDEAIATPSHKPNLFAAGRQLSTPRLIAQPE